MNAGRAPYAEDFSRTRGRLHPEPESGSRNPFRRDADRIIHSTAFRRLKHKTQVFVFHEGDHYRTRLTHSLEVAQIARAVARQLGLDEDLTETRSIAPCGSLLRISPMRRAALSEMVTLSMA